MLVHNHISAAAHRLGDKAYIIFDGRHYSFKDIDDASDRLASKLQDFGVQRGDRVVVTLENSVEMVIALWGSLKAGAVFVPIHTGVKADKLSFLLADSEPASLIASARFSQRVTDAVGNAKFAGSIIWVGAAAGSTETRFEEILSQPCGKPKDPGLIDQDLSLIIYTSGSTGNPKGVMMTHSNICNNVCAISTYLGNEPSDVVLSVLPLTFDYGLFQVLTAARVGFAVLLESSFAYPHDILKRISEYRVTGFPGVPTIFAKLLQFAPFQDLDLKSLRYLSNTAAPFPAAHISALQKYIPSAKIFSMYGLTECTRVSYLDPLRLNLKLTSVGRAMPNSEAYVVDETGCRCGPGEVGELAVRGSSVMRGYWRRPQETEKILREGSIAGEKILMTGDLFWADADGDLYFVGRRDDVFKCRGEKVSPREVESCLYELEAIAEVAVVGVPDPVDGMAIKAHIALRDGQMVTEGQLRKHCLQRLEPALVPRFFELHDSLPKTPSGKIIKTEFRQPAGHI